MQGVGGYRVSHWALVSFVSPNTLLPALVVAVDLVVFPLAVESLSSSN